MNLRVLASVAVVVAAAGCGSAGGGQQTAMIAKRDVAQGASDQLGNQLHEAPPVVDCANDLPRQVGAAEDCAETDLSRGQRHSVNVRVDRIDRGTVTYDVVVGAAPLPPPGD